MSNKPIGISFIGTTGTTRTVFQLSLITKQIKDKDGTFYLSVLQNTLNSEDICVGEYMKTKENAEKSALKKFIDQYKNHD